MRLPKFVTVLLAMVGCAPSFVDSTTPGGVPNLVQFAPRLYRMGQPPNEAAWRELAARIAPNGEPVVVVKLNDDVEGDDSPAEKIPGWSVVRAALPPEDDKPWTVMETPSVQDVNQIVHTILDAHSKGFTVVWHCSHGRDRTGLVSALLGHALFAWSKEQMEADMTVHGFRWILPDLAFYFAVDVPVP